MLTRPFDSNALSPVGLHKVLPAMSNPPTSLLQPSAGRHGLWTVRILTLVSVAFLCALIVYILSESFEPIAGVIFIFSLPFPLAFFWALWRLREKTREKGLRLAGTIALAALAIGLLILLGTSADPCRESLRPVAFAGLFVVLQIALLVATMKAAATLTLDEKVKLRRRIFITAVCALPLLIIGMIAIPNLLRVRIATGEASPAGSLRTINTAEVTYSSTYNIGYSPSLAALGPPTGKTEPSASAAGLIDGVLSSGVKSGYRFEYQPGPLTHGRIETFSATARPLKYFCQGEMSFYSDQSGVIRGTREHRAATSSDPPI